MKKEETMTGNQIKRKKLARQVLSSFLLLLFSQQAQATCLQECGGRKKTSEEPGAFSLQQENRHQSHNFGDNSTAIVGDVNIHVGHERIDIRGMKDSKNSVIDASITNIINLGGLQ